MSAPTPSSTDSSELPRVLVVDDEASMAEMVADGLSERGYDARHLSSSKAAARWLEEGDPAFDAVVTDLRMPGIDGLEMLSIAKRADPARPVIVMTAYSAIDSALESIRRGAYHYLTKPFKTDELAIFLGRALDEVRLRKETAALRRALHDLADLLAHFLARERGEHLQSGEESFAPEALELLRDYPWPGNVRELEHLVARVVVLGRSPQVAVAELPPPVRTQTAFSGPVLPIRELQRRYAMWAFHQLEGRRTVTAEKLGIDDKTLARWLTDEQVKS